MKTTAIAASRLLFPSWPRLTARLPAFVTLMKPRVTLLAVFTAFVALLIAPGHLDPLLGCIAIVAITAGVGAAGVVRRRHRCGDVSHRPTSHSPPQGLAFRGSEVRTHSRLQRSRGSADRDQRPATALLAFAIFFYVVVNTMWFKLHTRHNIVIGGAAGALPPVTGWASANAEIGLEPLILFLIIFLWAPPHSWALPLNHSDEYARADVPMVPVVAGRAATTRQILVYSIAPAPISVLPRVLGFAGPLHGVTAIVCGALLVVLAWQLDQAPKVDRKAAQRLFAFSIALLFPLFAALLIGSIANRGSSPPAWRAASACSEPGQAKVFRSVFKIACNSTSASADEA